MAIPLIHPAPPVVTQTAQTCWACAFESWSQANSQLLGIANTYTAQQMIDLFARDPTLTFGHTARASTTGIAVLSAFGFMDMRGYRTSHLHLDVLGRALESGYVYMIYFRVHHPAHAVVLYGADSTNLYVMDPMPGAGLVTLPAAHLLHLPQGRVVLGKPLLGDLMRGTSDALRTALAGAR